MGVVEVIAMTVIYVLLLIGALVCFVLAAANVKVGRLSSTNLVGLGLALFTLVPLIQQINRL